MITKEIEDNPQQNDCAENLGIPRLAEMLHSYPDTELVFGLVAAVGTNLENIVDDLTEKLKEYRYQIYPIIVSHDIIAEIVGEPAPSEEEKRIIWFMDQGNRIRQRFGNDSLATGVVEKITQIRSEKLEFGKRRAYIIKSVKHPDEVNLLRLVYGEGFYLIGANSGENTKENNLIKRIGGKTDNNKTIANKIIKRDEAEEYQYGQQTRGAFQLADFFVNITDSIEERKQSISRIIDLIFGHPYITPTFGEYAMFMAYCASLRSADLSRQIGAVICKNDEVLASGCNDCARFGGGLYWMEYNKEQRLYMDKDGGRDYTRHEDPNKQEISAIADNIIIEIKKQTRISERRNINKDELINNTQLADITEYSRVLHAEMEALMMCSRNNISSRDAELYCTTFPCHACAKLIVASGVKKVIYIEPYPKSKTFDYFNDSVVQGDVYDVKIQKEAAMVENKVIFRPFYGVGPRKFVQLFSYQKPSKSNNISLMKLRKDTNGKTIDWDEKKKSANSLFSMNEITYKDKEKMCNDFYQSLLLESRKRKGAGK